MYYSSSSPWVQLLTRSITVITFHSDVVGEQVKIHSVKQRSSAIVTKYRAIPITYNNDLAWHNCVMWCYVFFPGLFFIIFSCFCSFLVVWGWGFQLMGPSLCNMIIIITLSQGEMVMIKFSATVHHMNSHVWLSYYYWTITIKAYAIVVGNLGYKNTCMHTSSIHNQQPTRIGVGLWVTKSQVNPH